jgi:hypothetical protein
MGWIRSTHGREEKFLGYLVGNLKGRVHSENLGINDGIILEWLLWK